MSSLEEDLSTARALVRDGNFARLFSPRGNHSVEDVLKRNKGFENLGIEFVFFKNRFDLFWKTVTKKKKYDIVINAGFVSSLFLRLKGSKVIDSVDWEVIQEVKVANDTD